MKYTLKVTEIANKAGRFHYQVMDETGKVISERKSNREYVACTINGSFYFGRRPDWKRRPWQTSKKINR